MRQSAVLVPSVGFEPTCPLARAGTGLSRPGLPFPHGGVSCVALELPAGIEPAIACLPCRCPTTGPRQRESWDVLDRQERELPLSLGIEVTELVQVLAGEPDPATYPGAPVGPALAERLLRHGPSHPLGRDLDEVTSPRPVRAAVDVESFHGATGGNRTREFLPGKEAPYHWATVAIVTGRLERPAPARLRRSPAGESRSA